VPEFQVARNRARSHAEAIDGQGRSHFPKSSVDANVLADAGDLSCAHQAIGLGAAIPLHINWHGWWCRCKVLFEHPERELHRSS
jgi:hypothetical protein